MATTVSITTAEELVALPDDGIDRELIRGELILQRDVRRMSSAQPQADK